MDITNGLHYSHLYWIFALPAICALADIATGWIQASVNAAWDSTKMRQGLTRKLGELLAVVLSYIICIAAALPSGVPVCVSAYIVVMELVSVAENLSRAGVQIPTWIVKRLRKTLDVLNDSEDGGCASIRHTT